MEQHVRGLAQRVAARLPQATVNSEVGKAAAGGLRARATVATSLSMAEEAESGRALSALNSVVGTAHRPKGTLTTRKRTAGKRSRKRAKSIAIARNRTASS